MQFRVLAVTALFAAGIATGPGGLAAQEVTDLSSRGAGGRLVFFSSQYNDDDWAAANLIDGARERGWSGQSGGPQAIVIAFDGDRLAEIHDVVVNPYSRESPDNWVREVEVQVSTTYPFRGFRPVGRLTLESVGSDQVLSLAEPAPARYVKLLFHANRGGGYLQAAEVTVMGRPLADAPPAPAYRSLATPAAGARIERASSEYNDSDWAAANLLAPDGEGQWAGTSDNAQEVVIALAEAAPITDVAVCNYARENPSNWARQVAVEISNQASYRGFERVGQMTLPAVGDLHTLTLDQPVTGRWVKLLFQSNGGGGYMEAARVRVYQALEPAAPAAAELPAAAPTSIRKQLEATGRATVYSIHFEFNSAAILPESVPVLEEIAAVLRAQPDWELTIEGHTDGVGGADFNRDLSRRRADAVKLWLVDQAGIGEVRLTTVGYGLTRPIADNETEEGRRLNRRVELVRKR